MRDDQMFFSEIFKDQVYGLCVGEHRRWHQDGLFDLMERLKRWQSAHDHNGDLRRFIYSLYAGTGAGKTDYAGHISSYMLNSRLVNLIYLICPNRTILRRTQEVFIERFNIELEPFHPRNHRKGIPRNVQGCINTYQNLVKHLDIHRKICGPDTLAIFDEVHHLGEDAAWGQAASEAFGRVRYILSMTGTPFRPPYSSPIPRDLASYEEIPDQAGFYRFLPDFTYTLGDAIADGICREPIFTFFDGKVQTRFHVRSGDELKTVLKTVSFEDEASEIVASQRLAGMVHHTSQARLEMLRIALDECRREGRIVFIFLGGDTNASITATEDATEQIPDQLRSLGYTEEDFGILVGSDKDVRKKMSEIGKSKRWIWVSINLMSEGCDFPSVSAAIFLTTVTAPQTTLQRLGRALRMGDGSLVTAYFYMFGDVRYKKIALNIRDEFDGAVEFRKKIEAQRDAAGERHHRPEAICVGGGRPTDVVIAGLQFSIDVLKAKVADLCREKRLSPTLQETMLKLFMESALGVPTHE